MITGDVVRLWGDELRNCPFDTDANTLFIAYFASAEMGCFVALNWPRPRSVIDLYAEYRRCTNDGTYDDDDNSVLLDLESSDGHRQRGKSRPQKRNRLIDALAHFSLSAIG